MSRRHRRQANSTLPGYDNMGYESFHPASKGQPDHDQYAIDSDFGEEVHSGPYRSGPPPASYGWTPDHPATSKELMEDFGLRSAMEHKASKCIQIAEYQLGRNASQQDVEELALQFMDIPNNKIERKLASIMADDTVRQNATRSQLQVGIGNMHDEVVSEMMAEDEEIIDDLDMMAEEDMMMSDESHAMDQMGMMSVLAEEIENLKLANSRLARQFQKLADDTVSKAFQGPNEEELLESSIQEVEETLPKQASDNGIKRLANALAEFFQDSKVAEEEAEEEEAEEEAEEEPKQASMMSELEANQNDPKAFYEESSEEDLLAGLMGEEDADVMGLDMMSEDSKLARIFDASEEEEAEEEEAEEEGKKASLNVRPQISTQQNSVKTLGNISRQASNGSDELSKLWETAPDVSKYFG